MYCSITFKGRKDPQDPKMVKLEMIFYKTGYTRIPRVVSITGAYKCWNNEIQSFESASSEYLTNCCPDHRETLLQEHQAGRAAPTDECTVWKLGAIVIYYCYFFRRFSQYSDGVILVCFLNIRLRCWGYSKPNPYATRAMLSPVASSFFASCIMYWRI